MNTRIPQSLCLLAIFALCGCEANMTSVFTFHNPPPEAAATPESTVRAFLDAIPDRQVDTLRGLLADTKTCHITQETDPARPGIWVENWDQWLKFVADNEQATHVVDKLTAANLTADLASVTLTGHIESPSLRFSALITLTRKMDGSWRIVSWTQENMPN